MTSAGTFVGRVGGLAIALGVGAAAVGGIAVGWADSVPGNNVTPIPVILDGRERTVTMSIEDIAYTVEPGDSLTLQITSSAVNYENFTTLGVIDISDIVLDVPLRAIP